MAKKLTVTGPFLAPARIGNIIPQSAAFYAGLQRGDVVTHINGDPITAFLDMKEIVESSEGADLGLTVWRDGSVEQLVLTPKRVDEPLPAGGFDTQWRIGIMNGLAFQPATESVPLGTALTSSVRQVGRIIEGSISGLGHMITGGISTCNLSGPNWDCANLGRDGRARCAKLYLVHCGSQHCYWFNELVPNPRVGWGPSGFLCIRSCDQTSTKRWCAAHPYGNWSCDGLDIDGVCPGQ